MLRAKFRLRENVWAELHTKFYLKKGVGLLGFDVEGEAWIQKL